jgi:L-histidine Nalpha-methyltransferase
MMTDRRFQLFAAGSQQDRKASMAREIRAGLLRRPRSIPPKYFYDDVGSRLFDAICDLPEYYLTRDERELLALYSERIAEASEAHCLVEIGSGLARKTGPLLGAMCARAPEPTYVPFDIAPESIERSADRLLAAHPALRVHGVVGDFSRDCVRLAAAAPASSGPRLFAFLGSTIGNLDEAQASRLLGELSGMMTERDWFLLGVDLVKDVRVLEAAYNDAQGVTAAFNKNVLRVVARELDGRGDEGAFEHLAFYDEERERIEMHLVSTREQTMTLRLAGIRERFAPGERVLTEISRKFTRASVERMFAQGSMRLADWMTTRGESFALGLARPHR